MAQETQAEQQEQPAKKEKKGGFMKSLKKGVESTTGIKVSDETLLKIKSISKDPMYNFLPNKPTLVPFPLILNVPKETKSIDVKFRVN